MVLITTVKALIMAGGKGTRFWPFSRSTRPKQFLPILHPQSMLADTLQRMLQRVPLEHIHIVSLAEYVPLIREQLPYFPPDHIIVEPMAKDTAACIGLAALHMLLQDEDPVLITLPSDHYVSDPEAFHAALQTGVERAANEACVVTLGVRPTRPETGYGYIRVAPDEDAGTISGLQVTAVEQFIEKPPLPVAGRIFADGKHYWNTGIFIWKASTVMHLLEQHLPKLHDILMTIKEVLMEHPPDECALHSLYSQIENQSIDYGVIEKCDSIYMIPVHYGWDDLGNWNALERAEPQDLSRNVIHGLHQGIDTSGCIIHGKPGQLITTIGAENLIIVATDDVILVCRKDRTQDIKALVARLEEQDLQRYL
ncbi:mannose-1-phosphate guanylyltransferase [Paenibacillus dendritiformis]|nr:mannose-1-phosphate guanylyltransferase [Paenibacillus dendritiformis]